MNKQQLTGELIMPKAVFIKPLVGKKVTYLTTTIGEQPQTTTINGFMHGIIWFDNGAKIPANKIKELVLYKPNPDFLHVIHVDTFIEHGGVLTPGRPIFIARNPWKLWGTYAPDQSLAGPNEIVLVAIGNPATMIPRAFNREILGVQIEMIPVWK